jgi:hypothetical protein
MVFKAAVAGILFRLLLIPADWALGIEESVRIENMLKFKQSMENFVHQSESPDQQKV